MGQPPARVPEVDVSRPHPVRIYDYWLGGKDNYAADRELGDAMLAEVPGLAMTARAHRGFQQRAVRHLVADAAIAQFVLLGSGMPTTYNLHQVAQEIDPLVRVVYVDGDPVVAAHSRALLISDPKGSVTFVPGTVDDLGALWDDPALAEVLDLRDPVGVVLAATLASCSDAAARAVLEGLLGRLAPGSHLTLAQPTDQFDPAAVERARRAGTRAGFTQTMRSREQVVDLLAGFELVEPGVVPIQDWRPDPGPRRTAQDVHVLGAVARVP